MARVLVVTVAHPPADARIQHRQLIALREFGHEVTFAAPFSSFGVAPPGGVRAIDLPRSQGSLLRRLPAVAAAIALVVRERARQDVVLVHDPELLPALLAARLPSRRRPVAVWDVHEDVPAQVNMLALPAVVKRPLGACLHAVELLAERLFRLLLAETAYQDRFRRTHPVVPNSVRVPPHGPWSAEPAPRVVYLGSLTWPRGAAEVIELARLLPDVTFEVIGNAKQDVAGALRRATAELPNLDYRGFVPNDEALLRLPGALAGLSLLADEPNYAHSEPTKIMEYMAHSVPAITTPNPASRELVETTGAGIVVGFGDVEAAARAIRLLAEDDRERERLGRAAYEAAARRDWARDGAAFAATLEEWATGPAGGRSGPR